MSSTANPYPGSPLNDLSAAVGFAALSALCALELAGRGCAAVSVDPTTTRNSPVALAAVERMFDLQLGGSPHVPGVSDQLAQPAMSMRSSRTITSADHS